MGRVQPDFIIVGAPRAGTTWLCSNLRRHPEIFLPDLKEPRYFAFPKGEREPVFTGPGDSEWMSNAVLGEDDYAGLFRRAGADQLTGDASTDYLYRSEVSAERIRAERPDARIIVLLRDPVARAYSNWLTRVQAGLEPLAFSDAIEAEPERIGQGWAWLWHYVQRGYYGRQLQPFLRLFPREQILIERHEDISRDPVGLMDRVSSFLRVSRKTTEALPQRVNESAVPRSGTLNATRRLLRSNPVFRGAFLPGSIRSRLMRRFDQLTLHQPTISKEDRDHLKQAYAEDMCLLTQSTGLDTSAWV